MPASKFTPSQAEELARAFRAESVDFLFIGRSGAILLGYPETTQDVDIFLPRDHGNAERALRALATLGFPLDAATTVSILAGSEIVLLKGGPFALDLVFAPDGIENFAAARKRSTLVDALFPVASLDDIIASKRAAGREKDLSDLKRLEAFRDEFQRRTTT